MEIKMGSKNAFYFFESVRSRGLVILAVSVLSLVLFLYT